MIHAALDASGHVHIHSCCTSPVNLLHLQPDEEEYQTSGLCKCGHTLIPKRALSSVSKKFKEGWLHSHKVVPTIKRIFYVAYSGSCLIHLAKFSDYSNLVGNTQMQFHGTRRGCRIAESPSNVTCCSREDCNLCRILKGSYNMEKARGARMFGPGIYSTLVSSKADDYISNTGHNSKTRVMIVNHVALGRTKMMYEPSHDMQHAPHLYNSVTAATVPEGGKVNYHESVVYRQDAICANAIIVYQ